MDPSGDIDREEFWRDFLNRGDAKERRARRVFRALPHAPRCQLCAAPFAPVAPIVRAFGKRPANATELCISARRRADRRGQVATSSLTRHI